MADDLYELGDEVHGDLNNRLGAYDGSMLVKHVTLCEIVTLDGERQIMATHSSGIMAWETLGFLDYMRAVEWAGFADDDGRTDS